MKTCQDVMTADPRCATSQQTINEVAQLMKEKDVGAIPVVDDKSNGKLIGILTDRDIVLKVVAGRQDAQSVRVDAVMSSDLVFGHPGDSLEEARETMQEHQVRRLPIVDESQKLVGIVSQKDIAEQGENVEATGKMVQEISRG